MNQIKKNDARPVQRDRTVEVLESDLLWKQMEWDLLKKGDVVRVREGNGMLHQPIIGERFTRTWTVVEVNGDGFVGEDRDFDIVSKNQAWNRSGADHPCDPFESAVCAINDEFPEGAHENGYLLVFATTGYASWVTWLDQTLWSTEEGEGADDCDEAVVVLRAAMVEHLATFMEVFSRHGDDLLEKASSKVKEVQNGG